MDSALSATIKILKQEFPDTAEDVFKAVVRISVNVDEPLGFGA